MVYSGNLVRTAHYPRYTSVGGVDPGHAQVRREHELFEPDITTEGVPSSGPSLWQPVDVTPQTGAGVPAYNHNGSMARPLPMDADAGPAAQYRSNDRMVAAHGLVDYVPDTRAPFFQAATQAVDIDFVQGAAPAPPSMEAFVTGPNSYEFSNPANEVYSGDRWRLGQDIVIFGRYDYWTKQGQEAQLRAVEMEEPQFPINTGPIKDPAPYSPWSSGLAYFHQTSFNVPRLFAPPSETGISDLTMAQQSDEPSSPSDFANDGRL